MKKEEFIKYLEGMQQAFEVAGIHNMIELFDQIILEADTIEVTINNYPYYTLPYPWGPWWNSTSGVQWYNDIQNTITTAASTISETTNDVCSALLGDETLPQWEVKVTGPNEIDWEINKCD
jgi:hypothetical protein